MLQRSETAFTAGGQAVAFHPFLAVLSKELQPQEVMRQHMEPREQEERGFCRAGTCGCLQARHAGTGRLLTWDDWHWHAGGQALILSTQAAAVAPYLLA